MNCGTKISKRDLVPIFSWIFLKGKCRNCQEKISARYPAVELLNGLLWVSVFTLYGIGIKALLLSLLFSALVVVFLMDWDTQLINMQVVIFIAILAIPDYLFVKEITLSSHIIGAFAVSIPLILISVLSKGRAMGLGDAYLMAAAGLFLGGKCIAVAIFIGLISGSIGGLILKHFTQSSRFAFGPFLSIGIAVSAIYGEQLFNMYINYTFR